MNTLSSGGMVGAGGGGGGNNSSAATLINSNGSLASSAALTTMTAGGAGGGLSLAAASTKKRRKSDTNTDTQKAKSDNERKRRETENGFIEELAELISVNFEDMTAMNNKPDKCAILQQTVNQIRKIREQGGDGRLTCDGDGVQQGEVSSSKPALLDTQMLGTFLLEALDGFLFVVNTEGKIEYVSDNVTHFLRYSPEDLVGQEIYNIIHLGDHDRFSSVLLPSLGQWFHSIGSRRGSGRCSHSAESV